MIKLNYVFFLNYYWCRCICVCDMSGVCVWVCAS